ncbi:MAG: hypothetical protein DLM64_12125 [Solirubrobacterales bacterium]|nr:MAG: hypothetical protein DLM64_12125 [Solirubrobacterales bacterium]
MRPNILLVVLDAARRDAVQPYGTAPASTPAIAQLASRGHALQRAYATASWTLPSHASMFTGLLPGVLGLRQAPEGTPQSARPALRRVAERLLAQVLRETGYETQAWSTNLWASPFAGFDIGFDRFRYVTSGRDERMNALLGEGPRARAAWVSEGLRSRADDGAAEVGRELRDAISSWTGQPAFWFVNLTECHSPYLPPRPWNDLAPRERIGAALDAQRHLSFQSICLYVAGAHQIPDAALKRMHHLYVRAISYMDNWLAGVLEALDRRGILEQTLVIVTSDHGENFGEGGLIAHGFSLDERLISVPLVMAGPGACDRERVFSLTELPALIAGAAGLERHPWATGELPQGIAVAQYEPIGGRTNAQILDFAAKWGLADRGIDRLTASFTCATDGEHKLVISDGVESLYDLRADPGEREPLPAAGADGAALAALRSALEHPAVTGPSPSPAPAPAPAEPSPPPELEATEEELATIERQLKLLGYM